MEVRIEKQTDGTYIAYNTTGDHVTLIGTGNSVAEAKEDFKASYDGVRESYISRGSFMPVELTEDISFHFDLSSLFEYYNMFNVSALGRYLGINPGLMRQYKKGDTYISDTQLEKIEAGIHRLGTELAALSLV